MPAAPTVYAASYLPACSLMNKMDELLRVAIPKVLTRLYFDKRATYFLAVIESLILDVAASPFDVDAELGLYLAPIERSGRTNHPTEYARS